MGRSQVSLNHTSGREATTHQPIHIDTASGFWEPGNESSVVRDMLAIPQPKLKGKSQCRCAVAVLQVPVLLGTSTQIFARRCECLCICVYMLAINTGAKWSIYSKCSSCTSTLLSDLQLYPYTCSLCLIPVFHLAYPDHTCSPPVLTSACLRLHLSLLICLIFCCQPLPAS